MSAVVTGVVLYGSMEERPAAPLDLLSQLEPASAPDQPRTLRRRGDGLDWLAPKQDRLQLASAALTVRQVVHEQVQVRRDNRPFLQIKPYLRISARLAPASADLVDVIPSFNPTRFYATNDAEVGSSGSESPGFGTISTQVIELPDGRLPVEDRQKLEPFEVAALVAEAMENDPGLPAVRIGIQQQLIDGLTPAYLSGEVAPETASLGNGDINVTNLVRRRDLDGADTSDLERREVRVIAAGQGDTLRDIMTGVGAPSWQARGIAEAAHDYLDGGDVRPGQQVHVTLAPSLDDARSRDPLKVTIFDEAHTHRVTVKRTYSGEFSAQREPDQDALIRALGTADVEGLRSSLYASIYSTGLSQGLSPDQILQILKIFAYDTDYRRTIRAGDKLDVFLELQQTPSGELAPGEIVYVALTAGGEEQAFWRFRSQDGAVDFFNEHGQNNRKFLLRKPVRGNEARLTSGFGMRRHPILRQLKMHAGIDWAADPGTPIIAAGNGIITEARRKGGNGNFVSIQHANGYETTYSHMSRYGPGIREGMRVRQGTVIGYVGTTGLSTGAHLHFEVHVNGRVVDPLKIQVPRERTLKERELKEFQRERARMLAVMRSPPVRVAEK